MLASVRACRYALEIEVWISLAWSGNSLMAIVLAGLGSTVAMIEPGMWSIDAQLYGRKHLEDPRH